ncbi:hypothetical protein [Paenibacillus sp. GCM10027626]|uniref:hypothetical protein n=1 Tax=Paenibacillus sp. GCM10027626 TaxID=3273411 RepID=UPI0036286882
MKKTTLGAVVAILCLSFFIVTAYAVGNDKYEPVVPTSNMETAYIDHIETKNGQILLTVDNIDWYEGEAADKIFKEREPDAELDGAPDGYYIVNDSEELKTLAVDPQAEVLMQVYDKTGNIEDVDTVWNEPITVAKLQEIFDQKDIVDLSEFPYHLTVVDGKVVKIVQQFIP